MIPVPTLYNPLPSEPVRYFLKALKKVLDLSE